MLKDKRRNRFGGRLEKGKTTTIVMEPSEGKTETKTKTKTENTRESQKAKPDKK
jgi:hypothetical protein